MKSFSATFRVTEQCLAGCNSNEQENSLDNNGQLLSGIETQCTKIIISTNNCSFFYLRTHSGYFFVFPLKAHLFHLSLCFNDTVSLLKLNFTWVVNDSHSHQWGETRQGEEEDPEIRLGLSVNKCSSVFDGNMHFLNFCFYASAECEDESSLCFKFH